MGRLAEELAGLEVEDPLVGGRAVRADEGALGGPAVGDGQLVEVVVAGLARRQEDDRHVHHDVDEQAVGARGTTGGTAPGVEPQRQGPARP